MAISNDSRFGSSLDDAAQAMCDAGAISEKSLSDLGITTLSLARRNYTIDTGTIVWLDRPIWDANVVVKTGFDDPAFTHGVGTGFDIFSAVIDAMKAAHRRAEEKDAREALDEAARP